jgi:hypothetical protein
MYLGGICPFYLNKIDMKIFYLNIKVQTYIYKMYVLRFTVKAVFYNKVAFSYIKFIKV